jgi:outer membrane biosynthesis protein TonB
MRQVNNGEVNGEITRRAMTLPVAIPRGSEASVDLFFPLAPRPRRSRVVYADRHGEHRLDIDTHKALMELELRVNPPPTIVSRHDPNLPDLARRQGIVRRYVIANLTLDRQGRVQGVDVIESVPLGVFTQEARRTFQGWTYTEGRHDSRAVEARLEFKC